MWYNEQESYNIAYNRVQKAQIKPEDKEVIFSLIQKLLATKIKKRRAIKYLDFLKLILERGWLPTYHNVTETQLYNVLGEIEQNPDYAPFTKRDYKLSLKRILEHLNNPLSKLINTAVKRTYTARFFLRPSDILQMVSSDHPHLRDKAIVACFHESNCRPHEFFKLKRKDITFLTHPAKIWDGNGGMIPIQLTTAILNIPDDSKTGFRPVPLIFTVPYLQAWLRESHPDPEEYIWDKLNTKGDGIEYNTARKLIKNISKHAGIKRHKEIQLYSFRRGRNTELSQLLSYSQHCVHAGWTQDSDMPRVYNQITGIALLTPLLAPYGIILDTKTDDRQSWLSIMKMGKDLINEPM